MSSTVLLTGASGFIGKHLLLGLLKQDYTVIGTVRSSAKADSVKKLMQQHGADTSKLSFELLDLTKDDGWEDVAQKCDYIQHIASPFPMKPPTDREALVPIARDGALRVLKAAIKADVKHLLLTASIVSMMHNKERAPDSILNEKNWTDPEWHLLTAYAVSKTRAEKSVWELAKQEGYQDRLTTIHPGLVFGPTLDETIGTSLEILKLFLTGKYPAVPRTNIPIIDVRDVADLHILAMGNQKTGNRRLIAADKTLSLFQVAAILKKQYPDNRRLPKIVLPDFLVRIAAFVDPPLRAVLPDLGRSNRTDTAYVKELTGIKFRSSRQAIEDGARSLYENGLL